MSDCRLETLRTAERGRCLAAMAEKAYGLITDENREANLIMAKRWIRAIPYMAYVLDNMDDFEGAMEIRKREYKEILKELIKTLIKKVKDANASERYSCLMNMKMFAHSVPYVFEAMFQESPSSNPCTESQIDILEAVDRHIQEILTCDEIIPTLIDLICVDSIRIVDDIVDQ